MFKIHLNPIHKVYLMTIVNEFGANFAWFSLILTFDRKLFILNDPFSNF